jgi:hypothetical protein
VACQLRLLKAGFIQTDEHGRIFKNGHLFEERIKVINRPPDDKRTSRGVNNADKKATAEVAPEERSSNNAKLCSTIAG